MKTCSFFPNTVEQFLDDPEKLPTAFAEADFLFGATDGLDMIRLTPDSPACRHAGGQPGAVVVTARYS